MVVLIPNVSNKRHLKHIEEALGVLKYEKINFSQETSFIFLCFTNRCGSNFVADILHSTGKLNLAGEFYNWDTVCNNAKQKKYTSFQEYLVNLVNRQSLNGHFVSKIAASHLELLKKSGFLDQIINKSIFILVERSDKLRQAISFAIALQTEKWTSWMEARKTDDELSFSREGITNILKGFADEYKDFDMFFGLNGIVPINVVYEKFVDGPLLDVALIGKKIGIKNLAPNIDKIRVHKQTGYLNEKWRDLYLKFQE